VRLYITELLFDHPEWVIDLGTHLGLGLLALAVGFVLRAAITQLLVCTAVGGDLPNYFTDFMFSAFLDVGITDIGADHVFLSVQQFVDLGDIHDIGRRAHHAVHQARLIIDTDERLHDEVVLVTLLGLVHI